MSGIDVHYRALSPDYAKRVLGEAIAAGRMLLRHPHAGPVVDDSGLRKWRVARTPYILFYRPTETELRIVRVIHAAQDWRKEIE
jgi:toxin ParE1/3/4